MHVKMKRMRTKINTEIKQGQRIIKVEESKRNRAKTTMKYTWPETEGIYCRILSDVRWCHTGWNALEWVDPWWGTLCLWEGSHPRCHQITTDGPNDPQEQGPKSKSQEKLPYFDTCDRKRRVLLTQMEENPAQTPYSMCFEKYVGALLACPAYLRRFQSLPKPDCGFSFCRTKSLCAGGPSCLRISRAYSTLAYHWKIMNNKKPCHAPKIEWKAFSFRPHLLCQTPRGAKGERAQMQWMIIPIDYIDTSSLIKILHTVGGEIDVSTWAVAEERSVHQCISATFRRLDGWRVPSIHDVEKRWRQHLDCKPSAPRTVQCISWQPVCRSEIWRMYRS